MSEQIKSILDDIKSDTSDLYYIKDELEGLNSKMDNIISSQSELINVISEGFRNIIDSLPSGESVSTYNLEEGIGNLNKGIKEVTGLLQDIAYNTQD